MPRAPHDEDGSHWICFGGLTRSVQDSALMLDVMAPGIERPPRRPLKIAFSEKFPPGTRGKLTPAMHAALHDTAELLRDLGHEVEPKDPDFRAQDVPVLVALMFRGMRDIVGEIERKQRLERRTRAIARPGALVERPPDREAAARRAADRRARRAAVGRPTTSC